MGYKAKLEWEQMVKGFPLAEKLRPAFVSEGDIQEKELWEVYFDIIDDFSYETKSNFENIGETIGGLGSFISSVINILNTVGTITGLSGKESPFFQFLKLQAWKDTEPFRMSFEFILNTKTDPFKDVYAPAMAMQSMAILSGKNGTYYTPGINFKNLKAVSGLRALINNQTKSSKPEPKKGTTQKPTNQEKEQKEEILTEANQASKLIKVFSIVTSQIDGVSSSPVESNSSSPSEISLFKVYGCFIESCKPTWSKERTASGIPLWCKLDLTIQSIFSASDSIFDLVSSVPKDETATPTGSIVAANIFR